MVAVLTMQPLDRFLDYKAPAGGVFKGAFVEVPLGPRKVIGVVWGKGSGGYDRNKIRSIIGLVDVPPMREELQVFLGKVADYTLTAMSSMLRLATRAPGLTDPPGMRKIYGLGYKEPDRMTPARKKVLRVLRDHVGLRFTASELAQLAGVTSSVIKGLTAQSVLLEYETPRDVAYPCLNVTMGRKVLTTDQARVG